MAGLSHLITGQVIQRIISTTAQTAYVATKFIRFFKMKTATCISAPKGTGSTFDIKKQSFTHFAHQPHNSNSLINDNVFALSAAGHKKLWVGTEDGLDLFDEDQAAFTHYNNEDKGGSDQNNSIGYILDSGGTLWLGTYESGVRIFDRNLSSFAHFYKHPGDKSGLSNNIVTSFAETSKGFWIGTDGGGLNFLDQSTQLFTHYNTRLANNNHISGDHVLKLLLDKQQNLWISYYDAGLDVLNSKTKKITHYATGAKPDQISGSIVFGLAEDKNGDIWVGMDDNGLNVIHQGKVVRRYKYTHLDTVHSLSSNDIREIYRDKEGNMWVGIFDGLNLYNPATEPSHTLKPALIQAWQ